jgi:hypothetical protein
MAALETIYPEIHYQGDEIQGTRKQSFPDIDYFGNYWSKSSGKRGN